MFTNRKNNIIRVDSRDSRLENNRNTEEQMIYPDLTQYKKDSERYNLVPVFREVRADFETPVSIFMKVNANMLLESIEQGENVGRFSIIGLGRRVKIEMNGRHLNITEYRNAGKEVASSEDFELKNPLLKVKEYFREFRVASYEQLPPFFGGAIGFLGYETQQYFEDIPVHADETGGEVPDGLMVVPEVVLVYDSVKRTVMVVTLTRPGSEPAEAHGYAEQRIDDICGMLAKPLSIPESEPGKTRRSNGVESLMDQTQYETAVMACKEYIKSGDIIQAVLSQQFRIKTEAPPFELYRTLRVLNPSPYLFFLDFDDFLLIGSSPEVMVRVKDGELLLKPIAGTRNRGASIDDDAAIAKELLADPKERAEHLMLVDLGRNDLGRTAVPGSVRVTDFMKIEKFSHVMHIVSTIKAQLDEQYDLFDVIRACFPAGTLTGAPKIRAMEIINELENTKRGPYGGMVFNFGFNGNLDSCITIRTILLKGDTAVIQAGAGIVADSAPENEYKETVSKAQALIDAIQLTGAGSAGQKPAMQEEGAL
jgi:anthranilate synthase component 1